MNDESKVMQEIWRQMAGRFATIKFCQMQADLCVEGYPDKNTPTVLCYQEGDIRRQIVTLKELKGVNTEVQDIEGVLLDLGAVKYGDGRLTREQERKAAEDVGVAFKGIRESQKMNGGDDDSDWD